VFEDESTHLACDDPEDLRQTTTICADPGDPGDLLMTEMQSGLLEDRALLDRGILSRSTDVLVQPYRPLRELDHQRPSVIALVYYKVETDRV
jgi:hypothetical protein